MITDATEAVEASIMALDASIARLNPQDQLTALTDIHEAVQTRVERLTGGARSYEKGGKSLDLPRCGVCSSFVNPLGHACNPLVKPSVSQFPAVKTCPDCGCSGAHFCTGKPRLGSDHGYPFTGY